MSKANRRNENRVGAAPRRGRRQRGVPRQINRPTNRSSATRVLANGVGAVTDKPFGSTRGHTLKVWDAKHPHHLPLPRAVGPYTVIRATRRVQIQTTSNIIGTFQEAGIGTELTGLVHKTGNWLETVMISDVATGNPINGNNNVQSTTLKLDGLGDAATLVPSALSVQIMCPTALQSAAGIVYAGVMHTQPQIGGRTESWTDYMDKFVQSQSPRLLAASKLALRGTEIHSYPLNMTEVSKFTSLQKTADATFKFDADTVSPAGWAPIVIYNPSGATLELMITMEYRVRFDLDNPASSSHIHHPIASDGVWDSLVRQAVALGNGVQDIADVVANTGMAVGRAAFVGSRMLGGRQMLAIGA